MRCVSCNKALNDFEATRKGAMSGDYLDLCNGCIKGLGIMTTDRDDLDEQMPYLYEDPDYIDYSYLLPEDTMNIIQDEE